MRPPTQGRGGRLSRSAEFERVYRHGRSTASRHLSSTCSRPKPPAALDWDCRCRARWAARSSATVSSGCCARRSQNSEQRLQPGHDIVVVARPAAREQAEREGLAGVSQELRELLVKAGLLAADARAPAEEHGERLSLDRRAQASEHGFQRTARLLAMAPIVFYQRFVSPAIPRRCKYEPTCSRYALDAIREYGILKGLVLAGWRLLRCNPLSHGGYDPRAGSAGLQTTAAAGAIADRQLRPADPLEHAHPRQCDPGRVLAADQPVRVDHGVHPRTPGGRQLGTRDRRADGADPRDPRAAHVQAAEVDAGDAAPRSGDQQAQRKVQGGQTAPATGD